MSDFKAKMYQIQFWLGLRPTPRWEVYSALPNPQAGLSGPTSKGSGGVGERRGREVEGRGWKGGDGKGWGAYVRRGDETLPLHAPPLIHISGIWIRP